MCARFVCSLIHTTRPSQRPLMLVNAAMPPRQRALLVAAGAEVVEAPPLPPWNQSAVIWAARPTALRAYAEPKRIEQFYKLYLWHPAMVGHARRIVYIDPDALVIRSVAHLLDETHQPAPAALHASDRCAAQASIWQPRAGIAVGDGRVAKKCEYYWNAGVIVFEPSRRLFHRMLLVYREGSYPNSDPSCYASEQDVLQHVYWRELGGRRVHPLPAGDNFRGYPCSVEQVERQVDIHIVHQHSARYHGNVLRVACANGDELYRALLLAGGGRCPELPRCLTDARESAGTVWAARRGCMAAKASSAAERIREAFGEALSCDTDAGHDELGVRWCRSRQHGNDSLADGPIKRCKRTTGYCSQRIRLYPATTRVVLNFSGAARRGWRS